MASKTDKELLVEVDGAISAILLGAQEADYNSKKVKKANLQELYDIRTDLITKIKQADQGGIKMGTGSFGK